LSKRKPRLPAQQEAHYIQPNTTHLHLRIENQTLSGSKPDGVAARPHLQPKRSLRSLARHLLCHGGLRLPLSGDLRLDLEHVFNLRGSPNAPPLSSGQAPVFVLARGGGHGGFGRLPRVLLRPRACLESPLPWRW
jgi:hypothetical protein